MKIKGGFGESQGEKCESADKNQEHFAALGDLGNSKMILKNERLFRPGIFKGKYVSYFFLISMCIEHCYVLFVFWEEIRGDVGVRSYHVNCQWWTNS